MTVKKFSDALGNIGDRYIHEAIAYSAEKKRFWFMGTIAAILFISICATGSFLIPYILNGHINESLQPDKEPPLLFTDFDEFESCYRAEKRDDPGYYYVPANIPDNFAFKHISMREDVYIAVEYSVDPAMIDTEGLSDYGTGRISSLVCEYNLYEDGSIALNGSLIPNGFEPVEYQGRTVYRYDEYDSKGTAGRLIGYSIAFLQDGHLIYMHLPAIDTFENMMRYADVVKVTID